MIITFQFPVYAALPDFALHPVCSKAVRTIRRYEELHPHNAAESRHHCGKFRFVFLYKHNPTTSARTQPIGIEYHIAVTPKGVWGAKV